MKTVRNGQKVWPFCGTCGCRLEITETSGFHTFEGKLIVKHFGVTRYPYQDARRHPCSQVNQEHIIDPQEFAYIGT